MDGSACLTPMLPSSAATGREPTRRMARIQLLCQPLHSPAKRMQPRHRCHLFMAEASPFRASFSTMQGKRQNPKSPMPPLMTEGSVSPFARQRALMLV